MCDKVLCDQVVTNKEEAEEEEEATRSGRNTEPKTRTPHKVVGNEEMKLVASRTADSLMPVQCLGWLQTRCNVEVLTLCLHWAPRRRPSLKSAKALALVQRTKTPKSGKKKHEKTLALDVTDALEKCVIPLLCMLCFLCFLWDQEGTIEHAAICWSALDGPANLQHPRPVQNMFQLIPVGE